MMSKQTVNYFIKLFFWGSIMTGAILIASAAHCESTCWLPEGCYPSVSIAKPGLTSAFTKKGNFVMALMPDPNSQEAPLSSPTLCVGNVRIDVNNCHEAVPLPVPQELR